MSTANLRPIMSAFLALAMIILCDNACAQSRAKRPASKSGGVTDTSATIKIKTIQGSGGTGLVKPPRYSFTDLPRSGARSKDWGRVLVSYATAPDWIDQLTLRYYVLLKSADRDAEKLYMLLEGEVTYIDVEKGADHYSTIFVRPNTLKRYGEMVAVGVEITDDGKTVVKSDLSASSPLKDKTVKWWTAARANANVESKAGHLLNRSQTPFAVANHAEFEAILQ